MTLDRFATKIVFIFFFLRFTQFYVSIVIISAIPFAKEKQQRIKNKINKTMSQFHGTTIRKLKLTMT